MPYLVDKNVLCESSKPVPDASVLAWLDEHDAELQMILVTRNTGDFPDDVPILNPWKA